MNLLIELHYLPCLHYFIELNKADSIYLEACENFQKQTYRNRCKILTANKVSTLSIPICKGNSKKLIGEIEIDYSHDWQKNHWRTIQSAYGNAPYFEYYSDYLKKIYDKKPIYLWEFNLEIMTVCLTLMGIKKELIPTITYNKEVDSNVLKLVDKRSTILPTSEFPLPNTVYSQVFGKEFVPNLSIIDLIFNEGPNCSSYLKNH